MYIYMILSYYLEALIIFLLSLRSTTTFTTHFLFLSQMYSIIFWKSSIVGVTGSIISEDYPYIAFILLRWDSSSRKVTAKTHMMRWNAETSSGLLAENPRTSRSKFIRINLLSLK
jgi:hypothetical protein